ncbi:MAG: alpha-amylase family glycosyl hydrolase [Candidatus Marinimicrobia bacterium]|nr:alpha-amylase family glycosyl hydrolase [Candidatus Neomarinimicrobiota bacterium]
MRKVLLLFILVLPFFHCAFQENAAQPVKPVPGIPLAQFDQLYSNKTLGLNIENGKSVFRIFAPRANKVELALFRSAKGPAYETHFMTRDEQGIWEYSTNKRLWNKYYGYYLTAENKKGDIFNRNTLIPDPYSKVVSTQNNYHINARTFIYKDNFDWEGDTWIRPNDPRDLIIYEAHVRDLTAHPSSGVEAPGTYLGAIEKINYLKNLGINAVEFLPLHDFANIEIPYRDSSTVFFNTWNPYARNHWGYMSTFFFAPENYYGSKGNMIKNNFIDDKGKSVEEFKKLVKSLHNAGIAVLMDVVYNHTSTYDPNPFKLIDKKYYYRLDENQDFISLSGCGNDFKTERPMSRKMIVESILYWMKEFHVDGFRFDLGAMIDDGTLDEIIREARMLNPNVVIIAEPWGGGKYNPEHFSELGWSTWNDRFRNGIKGQNPHSRPGFIFGKWDEGVSRSNVMRFLMGSLRDDGGQYLDVRHSVNYLESHDDETFGDFVRVYLDKAEENIVIKDLEAHNKLTPEEIRFHKLGAFILGTSQGVAMIHSGQEFGRSKIIETNEFQDTRQGMIDRNSYNKDNSTNYLNYTIARQNKELTNFYSSVFRLRQVYPQLRRASRDALEPFFADSEFGIGYRIHSQNSGEEDLLILINGSKDKTAFYNLPGGMWSYLFSTHLYKDERVLNYITLQPSSGVILKK